jgi:predicted PurR-regulated permease PerM
MNTPVLATVWISMIIIAALAGVEWWMIAIGAVVAVIGWLLERNRD